MGGPIPTPQFNADISSWDTSKVTNMANMFKNAVAFDQLLSFDTSKVTDMTSMFSGAEAFNQPLSFVTSKVTSMERMFANAAAFNQELSFDTSKVTSMAYMFISATAFNQPLSFVTSEVTTMKYMFYNARAFDQPLSFVTSEVTTMVDMFSNAIALSDANKHLIRCAWEGTEAFNYQYDDWNEASFITKDPDSTKCAAGTELTELECVLRPGNQGIVSESQQPSGCYEVINSGGAVYFNDASSSDQVTSSTAKPICKRVCE